MQIIVLTTFASCCSNFLNDRKIALMMIHATTLPLSTFKTIKYAFYDQCE